MPQYKQSSPYANTGIFSGALDVLVYRSFPKEADDISFVINSVYALRPDKLAYDLYEDSGLWWVFAVRNPNTISDPIYDFREGITIKLPKRDTLNRALGVGG